MDETCIDRIFRDADLIFKEGQPGEEIFFIIEGTVVISKNYMGIMTKIAELKAGEFFGEMSLFMSEPRSATAMAKGKVKVAVYDRTTFLESIKADSSRSLSIIETLCKRLANIDAEMARLNTKGLLPKDDAIRFSRYTYARM